MSARQCSDEGCSRAGAVALRTTSPANAQGLHTKVWYVPGDAPKSASVYCAAHGATLLRDLVEHLSGPDAQDGGPQA